MTDQYFVRLWINRTDVPLDFTEEEGILREVAKLRGYTPQGLIEKAQEKESEWYHEGMRLKAIYKQLFKKEV